MSFSRSLIAVAAFSLIITALLTFGGFPAAQAQNSTSSGTQNMIKPIKYPSARKRDQTDDYHGGNERLGRG